MKKFLFALTALIISAGITKAQNIIYVDSAATGTGDGLSWSNAFTRLSDTLTAAQSNSAVNEIWVAKGTYFPQSVPPVDTPASTTNKDKAFMMVKNVKIYGGFAGNETSDYDLSKRDFGTNTTMLSGDFSSNDVISESGTSLSVSGNSENAYHVLIAYGDLGDAALDGFTIEGGNAASTSAVQINGDDIERWYGAGIFIINSSPAITNCTFNGNIADASYGFGGGLYSTGGNPVITNCNFTKNSAHEGGGLFGEALLSNITSCSFSGNNSTFGAGIFNDNGAGKIEECNFTGNGSANGAGIYNDAATDSIIHCTFTANSGNAVNSKGGGIYNISCPSTHIIINCSFISDTLTGTNSEGAAMYNALDSSVISDCRFQYNSINSSSTIYGAGIYNASSSVPVIIHCSFLENKLNGSEGGGGAVYNNNASPSIDRCFFSDNEVNTSIKPLGGAVVNYGTNTVPITNSVFVGNVSNAGGAIYNTYATPLITNCTFYANNAHSGIGGAIEDDNGTNCTITNTIIYGNSSGLFSFVNNEAITYSLIQGINADTGNHNIDGSTDPQFIDSSAGNFELRSSSPAIDAGTPDTAGLNISPVDLAGNIRIFGSAVDMGAYEQHILGNTIINNGDSSYTGLTGSLSLTGSAINSDIVPLVYKWQIKTISNTTSPDTSVLLINPADYEAYASIPATYGISFDSAHFIINDLSLFPKLMSIIAPGSDTAYWHSFTGNIFISRIAGPDPTPDSSISNTINILIQAAALPVTLQSFTGSLQNNIANLQWHTSVEVNFNRFAIEKSIDGKNYTETATIAAKGNNSQYTYSLPQPEPTAYYRLKLVNNDGSAAYSSSIALSQNNESRASVYPNPAKDYININVAGAGIIHIYDAAGKLIETRSLQAGVNTIDISGLNVGVYYGTVNGQKIKFMKE